MALVTTFTQSSEAPETEGGKTARKASLTRTKAYMLLAGYVSIIVFYGVVVFLPTPNAFVKESCGD